METYRIIISSDSRIQGSTLTNAIIPLNVSLFPKFECPEIRIETMTIDSGLFTLAGAINVAMPNITIQNMGVFSTTPTQSAIVKTFIGLTYDRETDRESVGTPISGANLMNSGFINIQLQNRNGSNYAVADSTKKWNMTLVIIDRKKE